MFLVHYGNITMFYHTHTVNGVTYCHSHISGIDNSNKPVSVPTHSKEQLKVIKDYNHITWNYDVAFPKIANPFFVLLTVFYIPPTSQVQHQKVLYYSLRAPPYTFV